MQLCRLLLCQDDPCADRGVIQVPVLTIVFLCTVSTARGPLPLALVLCVGWLLQMGALPNRTFTESNTAPIGGRGLQVIHELCMCLPGIEHPLTTASRAGQR